MSSRFKILVVVAVVIFLIVGYFYTQVDWEVRAVRKQFNRLVELVEKDEPVSTFEALGRSRKLVGFFTENASLEYAPGRSLPKGTDAMGGAFLSVWRDLDKASIRVIRHEVEIDQNELEAQSRVTAMCSVILNGAEAMGDTLKYRITWMKVDGDWRIQDVICLG